MPTIKFKTLTDGDNFVVLKDDADLSKWEPAAIDEWEFESRPKTTMSVIRAHAAADEMGVSRDALGRYNQAGYSLAFNLGYAREHCSKYVRNGVAVDNPTIEQIEALPVTVRTEYVARCESRFDESKAKKKMPEAPPAKNTDKSE